MAFCGGGESGGAAMAQGAASMPAIVRLNIGGCARWPHTRSQTAFRVDHVRGFVTALHGVAGCPTIAGIAPGPGGVSVNNLSVTHALESLDLAIVDGDSLDGVTGGFTIGTSMRGLEVRGYPRSVSTLLTQPLEARNPSTLQLRFLIPDPDLDAFDRRKSPDPNESVLNLRGHLTRGHSGAPILNSAGQVVGVGSGGLADGAVEISWGIPLSAATMARLAMAGVSRRVAELGEMPTEGLFVYENSLPHYATVTCFGKTFTAQRLVGHETLVESVDDKVLLNTYIAQLGVDDIRRGYVVFRDELQSIALVVPDGWTIRAGVPSTTMCVATSPLGQSIEYHYEPVAATTALAADARLLDEENARYCQHGDTVEPSMTTAGPKYSLLRGIVTRRKAYFRADRRCAPVLIAQPGTPGSPLAPGQLPPQWATWPVPPINPRGPLQCAPAFCNPGMTYPDVWMATASTIRIPYLVPISIVERWGFGSYTISESGLLMGFSDLDDATVIQGALQCSQDISFTPRCRALVEREREWATGAIAVISSTLTPR